MASALACIGLDVGSREEFDALASALVAEATSLGRSGRTEVLRWEDPSGARLVFEVHGGAVEDVIPSYDALAGAEIASLRMVDREVAVGAIPHDDDEDAVRLALELEERRLVLGRRRSYSGPVSIVGLGVKVRLFDDAEAFVHDPASLVHGDAEHVPDPPPHVLEFGLPWPPRMGPESVISYGAFAEPHDVDPYARVNGTVLGASTRTVERTGQSFHAVRVRTLGFEFEMCIPLSEHPELPRTGQVIGGTAFMVASVGDVPEQRGRLRVSGRG